MLSAVGIFFLANDILLILKKEPQKKDLVTVLWPIKYEYYNIGEALDIPDGELKSIKYSGDSDNNKLSEVLRIWANSKSSPVTWETIIQAVSDPPVNNKYVADKIREHLAKDDVFKKYLEL